MNAIRGKDQIINGIYLTSSGKVEVYLGEVEGVENNRKYGAKPIRGHLYWDVTPRWNSNNNIYKIAFEQDLVKSHFNITDSKELIRILAVPKTNLVQYLGQIQDVIPQGFDVEDSEKVVSIRRVRS